MNHAAQRSTPLVSIILPFLNGGAAFPMALKSILNQTYRNWELLLCDDGSTDGSLEAALGIRDNRVVVWSDGRSKGLAARLNESIDRAKGSLIARMDADDVSYPERLDRQVEYLERHREIDLVGCRMLIFGEDDIPLGKRGLPADHAGIVANPALGFGIAHPTWMARASWFRENRYDPAALRYEDVELLYRAHSTSRFANLPEVLYAYREMRGGFVKRSKTRFGRIRYLSARRREYGLPFVARAALVEALKAVADSALTSAQARYWMLTQREEQLNRSDRLQWQHVFESLRGDVIEANIIAAARSASA